MYFREGVTPKKIKQSNKTIPENIFVVDPGVGVGSLHPRPRPLPCTLYSARKTDPTCLFYGPCRRARLVRVRSVDTVNSFHGVGHACQSFFFFFLFPIRFPSFFKQLNQPFLVNSHVLCWIQSDEEHSQAFGFIGKPPQESSNRQCDSETKNHLAHDTGPCTTLQVSPK